MTKFFKFAAVLALTVGCSMFSLAGDVELVQNNGFETGDFTAWTLGGNCGTFCNVTTTNPHSGAFSAMLGPVGSDGTLSQTLDTMAGATYTFSFWLANDAGVPNDFSAYFDGLQVLNFNNLNIPGGFPYTDFVFTVTASTSSTVIEFDFRQDPAFWFLDDVSVFGPAGNPPPVPEPASMALLGTGLLAMGIVARKHF